MGETFQMVSPLKVTEQIHSQKFMHTLRNGDSNHQSCSKNYEISNFARLAFFWCFILFRLYHETKWDESFKQYLL